MQKKRSNFAHRAWNSLALSWARKGGAFKRRLITDLRMLSKFLKNLGQSTKQSTIHYGDHELSFENTPIIHIKIHRPSLINFWMPCVPCINPKGDLGLDHDKHNFELDNDFMSSCRIEGPRKSFSSEGRQDYEDDYKSDGDVMGNYCNDGPRKNFLLDGRQSCEDDSCCNDRTRKTLLLAGHEDFEDDSQSESDVTSIYYDDSPRSFWLGGHEDFEDDFESHGDARRSNWNDRPMNNILLGGNDNDDDAGCDVCEEISSPCDKGIDQRADQFIAKFYDELKLQRQIS